jgi:hypothetical protein
MRFCVSFLFLLFCFLLFSCFSFIIIIIIIAIMYVDFDQYWYLCENYKPWNKGFKLD